MSAGQLFRFHKGGLRLGSVEPSSGPLNSESSLKSWGRGSTSRERVHPGVVQKIHVTRCNLRRTSNPDPSLAVNIYHHYTVVVEFRTFCGLVPEDPFGMISSEQGFSQTSLYEFACPN